jgi:hypothetical protein
MPTTFHEREQAFEAKFAHDEEFRFLVLARRDKLFAKWGAETLGLPTDQADTVVKAVLAISNGPGHDAALIDYMANLCAKAGHPFGGNLSEVLARCMQEAQAQLIAKPQGYTDLL